MEAQYSGVEILEALQVAHNYNKYLISLVRGASPSKQLVDFGAGYGTFAESLRDSGCQVICIEPDSFQRQRLIARGFEALATIDSLPDDSVSLLFSLNVFEHIEDDRKAVKEVYQRLQPGGILVVYVPAFDCLWSSLDDQVRHYRRYTKKTLRSLVQVEGFSIVKLQYADSLGFIAALVFRLLRLRTEALTPASIGFYDRWVFPTSRVLDILFQRFFGKNVFAICRK